MTLLILYLALAIGVSFICSVSEAVLLSIRPSYIAAMDQNSRTARLLNRLQANLDRPLAAILTANTIAHTVGAAGVGAQATLVFGNEYLGITSGVLTFLILVFSEIIPKTLGATYWQQLAPSFGRVIHWMTIGLYPLVWMSERLTRLISGAGHSPFTYTRDEVRAMVDIGKEEGVLDATEHEVVSNIMKLRQLSVRDIMTPRTVIFSLPGTLPVAEVFSDQTNSSFSRIPVFREQADDITGYVLKTDLLIAQARDEFQRTVSEFERELLVLSETLSAAATYDRLTRDKAHMALVVDEYGTVQGLVTLEDVVETLIGLEITDEMDTVEDLQDLANTRWRQRMTDMGIDPDAVRKSSDDKSEPAAKPESSADHG